MRPGTRAFSVSFPKPNCCAANLTVRSGWHYAVHLSTSRFQSGPHWPLPRWPPLSRRRTGDLLSVAMTALCIPPPSAPTGRASSRRQTTRPPASGTPRPPRRSRSCAAMKSGHGWPKMITRPFTEKDREAWLIKNRKVDRITREEYYNGALTWCWRSCRAPTSFPMAPTGRYSAARA